MVRACDVDEFAPRHGYFTLAFSQLSWLFSHGVSERPCAPTTKLVSVRRFGDGHGGAAAGAEEHPLGAGSLP